MMISMEWKCVLKFALNITATFLRGKVVNSCTLSVSSPILYDILECFLFHISSKTSGVCPIYIYVYIYIQDLNLTITVSKDHLTIEC